MIRVMVLVSTHSRLKAAGKRYLKVMTSKTCFNTQPPEGGWSISTLSATSSISFNTQPPEGGWRRHYIQFIHDEYVSTHSRLKAAGSDFYYGYMDTDVSTHSRLKAAGGVRMRYFWDYCEFQHTAA